MAKSKKKARSGARRRQATRAAAARGRESGPNRVWLAAIALVVVVGVVGIVVSRGEVGSQTKPPRGVRSFEGLSRNHVQETVKYRQTPPVGGNHSPTWQNCGFYPEPIAPEMGVHSMEHGAVWITYRSDLQAADVERLRKLTSQTFVLVSPWAEGLPSPVVASAWGKQLRVPRASDPRLETFVRAFRLGPQTLEVGAACTGGQGSPQ